MTADRWSDLLALVAGVVGLAVVVRIWPRRPRRAEIARLRHPSTPPPVGVVLDVSSDAAHWRVATSAASLPTSVDIVTWQEVGTDDWRSEPIVEPVVLEPGGSALLPLVVDNPAAAHLVVVAWTVRHPGGDVQGSRTMTIGATSSTVPAAVPAHGGWLQLVASALVAGLLVVLVLVAGWRVIDRDDGPGGDDRVAPSPIATAAPIAPSTSASISPSISPSGADTTPTTAPSATISTTVPPTTAPTTEPAITPTTEPATAQTTEPATTPATTPATAAPTTSGAGSDGRSIDVRGRVEDCRFGEDCVIASFSAIGFPSEGVYVCEFDDGSRFTFRYAGGGAIDACATSGESPSITIEIDGVRSATISREAPDGA